MSKRNQNTIGLKKRPKIECEVCGENDNHTLQRHHIVERTEINTSNHDFNLAVLCGNCHSKVHAGSLEIIGVWPGTRPPTGRILVFKLDGVCNFPSLENENPPYKPKLASMEWKLPNEEETGKTG